MGFLFKIAVPKPKHKRVNEGITKISNKIEIGTVFKDNDGILKVSIVMNKESVNSDLHVLEFTERSYNLKGRTTVFSKLKNCIRYIRSESRAKHMPGDPETYIPFAPGWDVKGYIVRDNNVIKFDFKALIGIGNYKIADTILEDENP